MPANKNAVTRYYILDKLLANRYHHYSTEDLLQHVNKGCITIYLRHLRRKGRWCSTPICSTNSYLYNVKTN